MASEGPNSPTTGTSGAGAGPIAWTDPSNITASDNSRATANLNGSEVTHYLTASDFGFSIPASATIDGIVVEWEKSQTQIDGTIVDNEIRIVKGGAVGSTDKSSATPWETSDAYASYGGVSDLWGETWTDSDINDAGFGAALKAQENIAGSATARVDHVRITVYYTEVGAYDPATHAPAFYCAQQAVQPISRASQSQNILPIVTADYVPVPLPASFLRQHSRTPLPPSPAPRSGIAVGVLEPTLYPENQPNNGWFGLSARYATPPPEQRRVVRVAQIIRPEGIPPDQLPPVGWIQPVSGQSKKAPPLPSNRSQISLTWVPGAIGFESWAFRMRPATKAPPYHGNRSWFSLPIQREPPFPDSWLTVQKPSARQAIRAGNSRMLFPLPVADPILPFTYANPRVYERQRAGRTTISLVPIEPILPDWPYPVQVVRSQTPALRHYWGSEQTIYLEPVREPLPSVIVNRGRQTPWYGSSKVFVPGDGDGEPVIPGIFVRASGVLPTYTRPTQQLLSILEPTASIIPVGWLRPMFCKVPTLLIRGAFSQVFETMMGDISTATRKDDRDAKGSSGYGASSTGGSGRNKTSRGVSTQG